MTNHDKAFISIYTLFGSVGWLIGSFVFGNPTAGAVAGVAVCSSMITCIGMTSA